MLRLPSEKESAENRERNFRFAEVGFIVEVSNSRFPGNNNYALVSEKNEEGGTLSVVMLTLSSTTALLRGSVLAATLINKRDVLNVYATGVTDNMCKPRPDFHPHCAACRSNSQLVDVGNAKNYRVCEEDGLCRHIDCGDPHKFSEEQL